MVRMSATVQKIVFFISMVLFLIVSSYIVNMLKMNEIGIFLIRNFVYNKKPVQKTG